MANGILVHNSLGIVYLHNDNRKVSTRGSFTSEQSQWAQKWLDKNVKGLCWNYTYLCEIIYAENRIVIPYDFEGLVLLAVYDKVTGLELPFSYVLEEADICGFRVAKQHQYNSVDDIMKMCETLPEDQEGFVLRYANGFRLKIKGATYCRLHKLIAGITPLRVWELMVNGDNIDDIRKDLPEEILRDYDSIVSIFAEKEKSFVEKMRVASEATKSLTDKELGLALKNGELGQDEEVRSSLFLVRKKDLLNTVKVGGSPCRKRVYSTFKPHGNKLPGYKSSTAMNRFAELEEKCVEVNKDIQMIDYPELERYDE